MLDTHAWFWWVGMPQRLSGPARSTIERADRIGIATMSVFELIDLEWRRRIALDAPVRTWIRNALAHVEALPLSTKIALDAAQLRFAGNPADRIIYATARAEDAPLVTRDAQMHSFDPERAVW